MDSSDLLRPQSLTYFVDALQRSPSADVIYSDEDKMDGIGRRYEPFFKPAWSPDLLLSRNYISHPLLVRRQAIANAGGLRTKYGAAQEYDLLLRVTERSSSVVHIPHVLCHRKPSKDADADADALALQDRCSRAEGMRVEREVPGTYSRVRYSVPSNFSVSIIIPSGGNVPLLRANLESLFYKTDYPSFEVVVIDNGRSDGVSEYIKGAWQAEPRLRYIDWRHKAFNFSRINNHAARHATAKRWSFSTTIRRLSRRVG